MDPCDAPPTLRTGAAIGGARAESRGFPRPPLGARLQSKAKDAVYRADTEILCTDALARLAFTLKFGKLDPTSIDQAWNFSRTIDGHDPIKVFDEVLTSGDITTALENAEPDLVEYDRLQNALVEHLDIQARGGWPTVPEGEGLKLGSTGPRVVALRERLKVTGDLEDTGPTDPAVFGEGLEAAAKRFQWRHGIDADGKVGPRSLEELNVPVEDRIDQIRANLERARWVFRDVEDTYVIVDIAGYHLDLVEKSQLVWSTNVQVGKTRHATPVFKSTLKYIDFNPTWTIPPGILRNETLPAIRRDPDYLSRNNMSVVTTSGKIVDPTTIDWAATAGRFPIHDPARTGNAQCPWSGQVHLPQRVHGLPARHTEQGAFCPHRTRFQPRLHPHTEPIRLRRKSAQRPGTGTAPGSIRSSRAARTPGSSSKNRSP